MNETERLTGSVASSAARMLASYSQSLKVSTHLRECEGGEMHIYRVVAYETMLNACVWTPEIASIRDVVKGVELHHLVSWRLRQR